MRTAVNGKPDYITCPVCGMTSYHPQDVSHRYCPNCHRFHDEMTADEIAKATSEARRRQGRTPGDRARDFWYAGLVTVVLAVDYRYARGWSQFAWVLALALGGFYLGRRVRRLSV